MGLSLEINHGVFHEKHLPGVSKPWNATPAKAGHLAQPTPTVRPGAELRCDKTLKGLKP
jgi:hypothetical protein